MTKHILNGKAGGIGSLARFDDELRRMEISVDKGKTWIALSESVPSNLNWIIETTSFQVIPGNGYFADSSLGSLIAILPENPAVGDTFWIKAVSKLNAVYLDGNGSKVESSNSLYDLIIAGYSGPIIYSGSSFGWIRAIIPIDESKYILKSDLEFKNY